MAVNRPASISELWDLVKAMRAADEAGPGLWSGAEAGVLNAVSAKLESHVLSERHKYTQQVGDVLTELLRHGRGLEEALDETRRVYGEHLGG